MSNRLWGKYTVNIISENEIEFVRNKAERSFNAELYARWVDSMKPEIESRELDRGEVLELYQYKVLQAYGVTYSAKLAECAYEMLYTKIGLKAKFIADRIKENGWGEK